MAVVLRVGAEMKCEEPECPNRAPAELVLMGTGTFAFRPTDPQHGWGVALPGGAISAPYATRCPKHKRGALVTPQQALSTALAKAH